jgi:hypothetical protein
MRNAPSTNVDRRAFDLTVYQFHDGYRNEFSTILWTKGGTYMATPRSSMPAFGQLISAAGKPQHRLILLGGVLAIIGSFLPFYSLNLPAGMGSGGSLWFLHTGLPGILALLVAIALIVIGIMPEPSRGLNVLGLALATLVLGMLLYASTASGFDLGNAAAAAGLVGHGIGFYILWIGYLLLEYVYLQRVPR